MGEVGNRELMGAGRDGCLMILPNMRILGQAMPENWRTSDKPC